MWKYDILQDLRSTSLETFLPGYLDSYQVFIQLTIQNLSWFVLVWCNLQKIGVPLGSNVCVFISEIEPLSGINFTWDAMLALFWQFLDLKNIWEYAFGRVNSEYYEDAKWNTMLRVVKADVSFQKRERCVCQQYSIHIGPGLQLNGCSFLLMDSWNFVSLILDRKLTFVLLLQCL